MGELPGLCIQRITPIHEKCRECEEHRRNIDEKFITLKAKTPRKRKVSH
jgi:hypothetical protein